MKKLLYPICFSLLLLPSVIWAKDGNTQFHHGPNTAVRKYIKEQVMPVLLQKRQQFDHELSPAEKDEIAQCRAALKQLRAQHHNWKGNSDDYPAPDYNKAEQKSASNPNFEQRKAIMQRLQVIADNHSNSLQDIKTQLDPVRKQWISDIKKLLPVTDEAKQDEMHRGRRHLEHGSASMLYSRHFGAVHFLLLPATTSTSEQGENELNPDFTEDEPASVASVNANLSSFEVMPNPASNDVQLGSSVLPATNELKITDLQGKEVLNLENVQASQHLDVSQLASGTYLIQIQSGDQIASKKIVIAR